MLCASVAGAAGAVAPATQCPTPSRSRSRQPHPHSSLLPLSASFVSPTTHSLTAGMLCGRRRQPLAAGPPCSAATTAAEAAEEVLEDSPEDVDEAKERVVVAVKGANEGKPRLVLKFIWMDKNIGLALDQMVPGHGTIPLSSYYFWPRKDAWEELKALLESKPWISQKRMIILLNQATDIINLWQQSGAGNLQQ
ncbi:hypothetical protein Taro_039025 [Colocasia esculenta]|uniref:30S ribosomal protein 3, chloroplastic n=1 Tax=Colocasia esculenta TaxID=4460 RepID=A0A843WQC5_COLES|nr:hypothetical protein [Colocasia esculenta]